MTTPVPGPAASVLSAILVTNPNDPDSPLSVAVFSQSGEAPLLPSLGNDVVALPQDAQLDANGTWSGFLSTLGLTGATAPARWVGSTAAAAPTTGTFSVGDFVVSADGNVYVCTAAGTPGTWAASGSGGTATLGGDATGTVSSATVTNAHLTTQSVSSAQALGPGSAPVVLTDTTAAAFTLTLPASPQSHSWFIIVDDTGQWATHNLTIGRNGKNIDGAASNIVLSTQWGKRWLYYDGTQWWTFAAGAASGGVTSVTATDTSIVVGGTGTAPTIATGTLDVIAADHPPAANWSNNSHKITSLSNGSASSDAAAFGQTPAGGNTVTRAQGGTGVTTTPAAPANFSPANPTATGTGTLVMMGLGSTCTYTPASSGNVMVTITGNTLTNTAAVIITLGGRFGTGTAPSNGATATGTRFGASTDQSIRAANFNAGSPFALNAILSLTPSTAYWFDVALQTATGTDTAQITSVGVSIYEIS